MQSLPTPCSHEQPQASSALKKVTETDEEDDDDESAELLDLAIVGAGVSGLMAAKTVADKNAGINFRLFEKSSTAGGKLGGLKTRWITPQHYHAMCLCRDLNIPLTTVWRQSEVNGTRRTPHSIGPFSGTTDVVSSCHEFLVRLESLQFMAELDCLCTVKHIGNDARSMDDFLRRKLLFERSRKFFRFLVKIGTGFYPAELTVSDCLKLFRSMSSVRDLYEMLTLHDGHLHPTGYPNWDVLVDRLLSDVGVGKLNYSTNIVRVELGDENRNEFVTLTDSTGKRWRARYVILAVSCQDLERISILPVDPPYSRPPDPLLGLWSMANFTLRYRAPYWRDHGFTGSIFSPSQDLIVYESGRNQLSGTYFSPLRGVVDETERVIVRATILQLLRKNFCCRTMQNPLECRLEIQPIPYYFDVLPTYRRCLIFASTNVSCWYRGFINGSIQAGIRAAILALLEIRPQTITFREVTDIQCIHFKYFRRRSAFERFWCKVNLASVCRFVRAVIGTGTVVWAVWVSKRYLR